MIYNALASNRCSIVLLFETFIAMKKKEIYFFIFLAGIVHTVYIYHIYNSYNYS